jgi:hypothetical protein
MTKTFEPTQLELQAAREFLDLQSRKIHPEGRFDKAKRFYLDVTYECCTTRSPSRAYPYSQMVHGRTAEHVAHKYGLSAANIRKTAQLLMLRKEEDAYAAIQADEHSKN